MNNKIKKKKRKKNFCGRRGQDSRGVEDFSIRPYEYEFV
jgi:hypothetical protein